MVQALELTVVVAPPLRSAFEGRSRLSLGLPATADLGEMVEALLRLYPRSRGLLAGDRGTPGGRYMHLVLDAPSATGHKIFVFALSLPPASSRPGLEG